MDNQEALAACLADLAAGDPRAGDRIVELCGDRFRAMAHRMLGRFPAVRRHDDTDDVLQGAVLRLHRALTQMARRRESPRSLMALAATQLHRELVDLARRNTGASSYAANHDTNAYRTSDAVRFFVDEMAAEEDPMDRWEEFHAAIAALPPDQREVFHLAWYLGADQKTIAEVIGCSERTVRSSWIEAREAVKSAIDGSRPS